MGKRKCSKKIHYHQEFGDGPGSATWKSKIREERLSSCGKQRSRARSGPFHIPGPGTVLGEHMGLLSEEIGSSVSGWVDAATQQGNSLMREAPVGFSPTLAFCKGPCTVHSYTTFHVLQEVI